MAKDSTVSEVLEINNLKINGLEVGVAQIRDGAVYIGGMTVATKLIKSSSLPIGAKLGATVLMGATSLIGYKMVENNLSTTRGQDNVGVSAENINTNVSLSNNSCINKLVADSASTSTDGASKDYFNISSFDLGQLQLDLRLQMLIICLLVVLLVFLIMKNISERDLKLEFLNKVPFIQTLFLRLFKL